MPKAAHSLNDVTCFGSRFARPECVLATRSGDVFASDRREHRLEVGGTLDLPGPLHPNGIALERGGSFLVAHLGTHEGGVFRLTRDG